MRNVVTHLYQCNSLQPSLHVVYNRSLIFHSINVLNFFLQKISATKGNCVNKFKSFKTGTAGKENYRENFTEKKHFKKEKKF